MSKLPILLLGAVALGGVMFWFGARVGAGRAPEPRIVTTASAPAPVVVPKATPPTPAEPGLLAAGDPPSGSAISSVHAPVAEPPSDDPRPSPAEADMRRLEDAVTTYSASGLPVVARYLKDPNPELRRAAREGMLQMGLAEAAPLLREAADHMADPREAVLLLDAADFLSLPTVGSTAMPVRRSREQPPEISGLAREWRETSPGSSRPGSP